MRTLPSAGELPRGMTLRKAQSADLPAVFRLLDESSLPRDGAAEWLEQFVVAVRSDATIAGVAGLEFHDTHALLRSVAVSLSDRGRGIGAALVADRLHAARERGVSDVTLLTTTAVPYFQRLGFAPIGRDKLPAAIRASVEFTSACPESAVALTRSIAEIEHGRASSVGAASSGNGATAVQRISSVDDPEPAALREKVRARYAEAARAVSSGPSSCCGSAPSSSGAVASSCGCSTTDDAARGLASCGAPGLGYDVAELGRLPREAVDASLGCGNPIALAELREGETVLDLGSGGGIDVLLSARRVGPSGRAYGLDMTDEMLALAQENQRKSGIENATFLRGTLEDVPLPDATVDVVISNCVINLSTDKSRAIAEAFRVLRPGGRFAVADIVTTRPMPPAARKAAELWAGCVAGALTIDEYRAILADVGFEDVVIEPVQSIEPTSERSAELASWPGQVLSAFVRATKPIERGAQNAGPSISARATAT